MRDIRGPENFDPHMASQYDQALRLIYDELYELNVTDNSYRIIYHVAHKYVIPPETGHLDFGIANVAEHMIFPGDKGRFLSFFDLEQIRKSFAAGQECMIGEFRKLWEDGDFHWASLTLLQTTNEGGQEVYLCFIMDIGAKKQMDEVLEQNRLLLQSKKGEERYRIVVEQTGAHVMEWNLENRLYYQSDGLTQFLFGRQDPWALLNNAGDIDCVHPDDKEKLKEFFCQLSGKRKNSEVTLRLKKMNGGYSWCRMAATCIRGRDGTLKRVIGTINDIDEVVKAENELKYRAEYDILTGIYNQFTFEIKAQQLLQNDLEQQYAVVRMDVNRFKLINDLYGVEVGDGVLHHIAAVLQKNVAGIGICARNNSDIFDLCVAYSGKEDLDALVESIEQDVCTYREDLRLDVSFGICPVEERTMPVNLLCDRANLALKSIKGNLVKNWVWYDKKLREQQMEEREIESEMNGALASGQFVVYLQPKHNIATAEIVGAESLVRWKHPQKGLIPPNRFIPLFERNGFIVRLDEYVWEETCKILRRWLQLGYPLVPVSVNVSRVHAYNPSFYNKLSSLTLQYGIPNRLLELELTESTFIDKTEELYQIMRDIKELGFHFAMDDFGSGYSSLNMLKDAPINVVKFDREFFNESTVTKNGRTIVRHMIEMATELGFSVVAEGVETQAQVETLVSSGCSVAQGFFFSRPMPSGEFEALAFCQKKSAHGTD